MHRIVDRGYRSRHVSLDTSWLAVGHVDEIVSHIVTGVGPCEFALVRAAPTLAVELVAEETDLPRWLRCKSRRYPAPAPRPLRSHRQLRAVPSGNHATPDRKDK